MNALRTAGENTLAVTFYVVEAVAVVLSALLIACVILVSFVVREYARGVERRRSRTLSRTRTLAAAASTAH